MAILLANKGWSLSNNQVVLVNKTGPYFILDHNKPTTGPRAGFLSIEIKNTTSVVLSKVQIRLSQIVGTGYSLGLNEDSSRYFQEIPAGKSVMAAFYIKYPSSFNTVGTFKINITDVNTGVVNFQTNISTTAFISASAGGLINKRTTSTPKPVGQVWTDTIRYHFGNMLVGDRLFFQPVSNANFDCKAMYLMETEVIYSEITGINVGDKNTFCDTATGLNHGSNGAVIIVNKYVIRKEGQYPTISPVCATLSGNFNKYLQKYGDLETGCKSTSGKLNELQISKSVNNPFPNCGDTISYLISIYNPSVEKAYLKEIHDILPEEYSFLGIENSSEISEKNTNYIPQRGAIKHMCFESDDEEGYLVPAKGTLLLKYKVKVPSFVPEYRIDTNKVYFKNGYYTSATAYSVVRLNAQPLPIRSIKAKVVGSKLTWDVEGSSENAIFVINGVGGFEKNIANIPAIKGKKHYELPILISNDFDYYQIQVLENGLVSFSTLVLNTLKSNLAFSTYPNPFNQEIQFRIPNTSEPTSLMVYNIHGQIIAQFDHKSEFVNGINTDSWPVGLYFFHLKQADAIQIFKATKVGR